LINKVVVPLHPIVPNPYTLLAQIPPGATYYSVLDLKDASFAFFYTPNINLYLLLRTQPKKHVKSLGPFLLRSLETASICLDWL
jgi:hypothetical protein